jgi:hypothetical protein
MRKESSRVELDLVCLVYEARFERCVCCHDFFLFVLGEEIERVKIRGLGFLKRLKCLRMP